MILKTVFYTFFCCLFLTNAMAEDVAENLIENIFSVAPFSLEKLRNVWYYPTMPTAAYTLPMSSMERITSDFGPRKQPSGGASTNHRGIDIGMYLGVPLLAQAPGKIIDMTTLSEWNSAQKKCNNTSGCMWDVYHCVDKVDKNVRCKSDTTSLSSGLSTVVCYGNGISVAYFHLSSHPSGLRVGSQVKTGDIIGYSGKSGVGAVEHLHYQVAYTPESPDDCKGWTSNTIDPLCPFNMTLLPFYYKIERRNTAKGPFRSSDQDNLCYGWPHLDGENGEWRHKRIEYEQIAPVNSSVLQNVEADATTSEIAPVRIVPNTTADETLKTAADSTEIKTVLPQNSNTQNNNKQNAYRMFKSFGF